MDVPMSDLSFRAMAAMFQLRDLFSPREPILREAGIRPGQKVLDFGCGPGSYTFLAAEQVGSSGKVYAVDIQPLALVYVRGTAARRGLTQIETLASIARLPKNSIDVVLLYDIFHMFSRPEDELKQLRRILKIGGTLSCNDHHLTEDEMVRGLTRSGHFKFKRKGQYTHTFVPTA